MEAKSQEYLNKYLESLTDFERSKYHSYSTDYFCADEKNANLCAELIRTGQKTATCSLKYWYESDDEPMPTIGHLMIVTKWDR